MQSARMEWRRNQVEQKRNHSSFLAYGMYALALMIMGTNGVLVSHISITSSQIVLMRTLIGGILLTGLVFLRGGFNKDSVRSERIPLLLGGAMLGELRSRKDNSGGKDEDPYHTT